MYLFKNEDKYYLSKNNNKYYGWDADTYVIKDGRLVWANPNIYLQSSWTQYIDTKVIPNGRTTILW